MRFESTLVILANYLLLSGKVSAQFPGGGQGGFPPQGGIYPPPYPQPYPAPYPAPYPRPNRYSRQADGGLLGSVLGGVFGGGNNGVQVGYGRKGLVGGILDAVFGNECNGGGIIGSILGTGNRHGSPACYANELDYISLTPQRGQIINTVRGASNTQIINIQGLPKTKDCPNGILQIQGPEQNFKINNGQYFINPDPSVKYQLSYL